MTEIDTKLLPCRRCGQSDAEVFANAGWFIVECNNCPCRTTGSDRSAEAAIAAWNRRSASPSIGRVEDWPGDKYELYEAVHNKAIAEYEAATPTEYRYSATALRRAVDAAIRATLVYHEEPAGDTQPALPVGDETQWVLVPREPTEAMLAAMWESVSADEGYSGMLAAAPAALVSPPDNGEPVRERQIIHELAADIRDRMSHREEEGSADWRNIQRILELSRPIAAALQSHNEGSKP